jgi:hypothetical protein
MTALALRAAASCQTTRVLAGEADPFEYDLTRRIEALPWLRSRIAIGTPLAHSTSVR